MRPVSSFFAGEELYPDLDTEAAVNRLSEAIRCRTINYADHSLTDFSEFDRLQELMRQGYPHVMRCGSFELIGHAVLITIPGTEPELRPCLYMSHQDVVPVVAGTEKDWCHDAFSGAVDETYLWGRGTLDIKDMVFGILEAAEYLLSRGQSFRRTAYLAFGDDEETLNLGALAIAETLESRGVRLEFLLDEGSGKIEDGACFGAPGQAVSLINLMEKGYADLELSVESAGGHSSRPFGGSSLEHLARAITAITDSPFPVRLPEPMAAAFEALAPYITEEPLRSLAQDVRSNAGAIAEICAGRPETFPFVTTTIAPTMIEGGSSACNVLPHNMRAVINFRLNQGDSTESVMSHCRSAVEDPRVRLRYLQANDPSHAARSDSYGYRTLTEVLHKFFPEVLFIPAMMVGATDACRYERICDCCLRCSPFLTEAAEAQTGVHGTNERISLRSYAQGIRVLIRLMELANIQG
ncbi:MAG: M20/M25/M40 family metallo-hydrolase [Candidatus Limivicinus sp.]